MPKSEGWIVEYPFSIKAFTNEVNIESFSKLKLKTLFLLSRVI
ncbi:hypothetical protein ACED96_14940 [Clostridium thermobutyricum]